MLKKELYGFGELFRMLSFREIGSAAMLSRAVAGIIADKVVFSMPGSSGAVKLAMNQLILPELGHIVRELRKTGSN
jgi:molybdenum cofactor biosynthesis protein B